MNYSVKSDNARREIIGQAIFGSMDGLVSVLGVIIGLAASTKFNIVCGAVGLAAASVVSMAFGEYLGDDHKSLPKAITMGIGTLVGTLLPLAPFFFLPKLIAFIVAGVITIPFGFAVGSAQQKGKKGYILTFIMLYTAIAVTIVVSLLIGATG